MNLDTFVLHLCNIFDLPVSLTATFKYENLNRCWNNAGSSYPELLESFEKINDYGWIPAELYVLQ